MITDLHVTFMKGGKLNKKDTHTHTEVCPVGWGCRIY